MSQHNAHQDIPGALKGFHRAFPTGVTIVTTDGEGTPYGLAVNAFSSVSLDPPMVMACVNSASSTYQKLFANDVFGVSILASDQLSVAQTFAKSGIQKFSAISWSPGRCGAPLIDGASAQLEFRVKSRMLAGTHTIFVGVVTYVATLDKPSLIYSAGKFYDGGKLIAAEPSNQ